MNRRRTNGELGQGLVEFAVIFPIFIFLIAIVFDVGLGFNRQATIQHAVREGARYAALRDNADDGAFAIDRTIAQSQELLDATDVAMCYTDMDGDGVIGAGDAVDVEAQYTYQPIFLKTIDGLFGADVGNFVIDISGSSRLERALAAGHEGPICS